MLDYDVRPTDTAKAKGGDGLEGAVRKEIAGLLEDGLASPLELIFHSFEYDGEEFICYPRDGAMEVDTCYREDGPKVGGGPFEGMSVSIPRGDSGTDPLDR